MHGDLPFYIASTDIGVLYITLGNESFDDFAHAVRKKVKDAVLTKASPHLEACTRQLDEYFAKERTQFSLELDLRGTPFQISVWQALQNIPYGMTWTYSQVARSIGKQAGFRAVGSAIGKNPISIIIPCHRVIGKDGSLTGYAGGLTLKQELLQTEGVSL